MNKHTGDRDNQTRLRQRGPRGALQLKPGQNCTYSFGCPGIRGSEWKVRVLKNTLRWQACVVLTEKENFGLLKIGTLVGLCRANEAIVKMGIIKGLFLNTPKRV